MAKNAAAKQDTLGEEQVDGPPQFSDKVKEKARRWFSKGKDLRERRDYDYAIECYLSGLEFWPEAVEDGHMPLRSLAIQRQQAGGKKPGMMGGLKKSMTGKDTKKCLLNAEHLLSKDPGNAGYLDGLLKNANRTDLSETLKWITPLVFESMRKEKKTNIGRFKSFRQVLVEAGLRAGGRGDSLLAAWFYERAVNAIDYLVARNPSDMALKDEQRDLAGKLTIARGKYGDADSFRESLQDGDKQKLLHDAERAKQGEQTLGALISAARKEYEEYAETYGLRDLVSPLTRNYRPLPGSIVSLNGWTTVSAASGDRLMQNMAKPSHSYSRTMFSFAASSSGSCIRSSEDKRRPMPI